MGGTISNGRNNDELVDNLIEADYLKTVSLQQVFRAVDRGDYYTYGQREKAYRDSAWRNGNLHLSAPCVYSEVMEALKLKTGHSFLNLGSGSGYLSTIAGLILGPYGINHGIELFQDVISFAYGRLNDFVNKSEAIDAYEFCVPTFVAGNCLRIDSNCQLYDRVYCGASCPEEHETYMKHLIKVGGILVMPLNNKLLRITRTGESTWESTKVLSVSFAPLLYPTEKEPLTFVKLPDFTPPSLQELCRSLIRTTLRARVESEHPSLQEKKKSSRNKEKGQIRRFVIPLIDQTDSRSSRSNSDNDDNDSDEMPKFTVDASMRSRTSAFIENFMRGRAEIQEVIAGPSNWRSVNSRPERQQEDTSRVEETDDSDTVVSTDEEKSQTSDSGILYSASFVSESKESSEAKTTRSSTPKKRKRRRHSGTDQGTSKSRKRVVSHPKLKFRRRTATFIWKRIVPGENNSASDNEEETEAASKEISSESYKSLMVQKVLSLPLPTPLQRYINYRRENI